MFSGRAEPPIGYRRKLILRSAGLFAVGVPLCLLAAYILIAENLRDADRTAVESEFTSMTDAYRAGGVDGVKSALGAGKGRGRPRTPELFVRITEADAGVVFSFLHPELDDFESIPAPAFPNPGPAVGDASWRLIPSDDPEESLLIRFGAMDSRRWLEVGLGNEETEETLSALRMILAWTAALLSLGGPAAGFWLSRQATSPLRDLIETVKAIKEGRISARVPMASGAGAERRRDELEELKALFNSMLDQNEALIDGMKRTTEALAHDIRTPLTRLRTGAELALNTATPPAPCLDQGAGPGSEKDEALAAAIENADQLLTMVDTIMEVASTDSGAVTIRKEKVDLGRLLAQVMDLYSYSAEDKGISLEAAATDLQVIGDPIRLLRAFSNLVDNAIKFSPSGSSVTMRAQDAGSQVKVIVSDSGPGIAQNELPYIWRQLYRGDTSRSTPGMGLGLSLVRAIITLHRGSVEVDSILGKGSDFKVFLPKS